MNTKPPVNLAEHALRQASASAADPWSDRTTASHWHEGQEWAVVIDWAEQADGTRVPATVILSSLGGTLTDKPAPGATPHAVTRALIQSVKWAQEISEARANLSSALPGDWEAMRQYERTPADQARQRQREGSTKTKSHDDMLRLVARLYLRNGGEDTPKIAEAVARELQLMGVTPMRRGKPSEAGSPLSESTVRRWIKECRQPERRYLAPFKRSSKTSEPSGSGNRKEEQ